MQCSPGVEARHGGAENGVGPNFRFVGGSIKFNHHLINHVLLIDWKPDQGFLKVCFDVSYCLVNARPHVSSFVAVSEFERLVSAG